VGFPQRRKYLAGTVTTEKKTDHPRISRRSETRVERLLTLWHIFGAQKPHSRRSSICPSGALWHISQSSNALARVR
jgi:hypothetical protein